MKAEYSCMCCRHKVAVEITDRELHGSLKPGHWEACPECGQRVGTGPIQCRSCGKIFVAVFPHSRMCSAISPSTTSARLLALSMGRFAYAERMSRRSKGRNRPSREEATIRSWTACCQ